MTSDSKPSPNEEHFAAMQSEIRGNSSASDLRSQNAHALYSLPVTSIRDSTESITIPACEVCHSGTGRARFTIHGTKYSIVECVHCGLGVLLPTPTMEEIRSFYPEDYYGNVRPAGTGFDMGFHEYGASPPPDPPPDLPPDPPPDTPGLSGMASLFRLSLLDAGLRI